MQQAHNVLQRRSAPRWLRKGTEKRKLFFAPFSPVAKCRLNRVRCQQDGHHISSPELFNFAQLRTLSLPYFRAFIWKQWNYVTLHIHFIHGMISQFLGKPNNSQDPIQHNAEKVQQWNEMKLQWNRDADVKKRNINERRNDEER